MQGKKPAAEKFDDFEHADALAHSRQVRPQDEIAALGGCRSLSTWSPVGCRLPTLDYRIEEVPPRPHHRPHRAPRADDGYFGSADRRCRTRTALCPCDKHRGGAEPALSAA